MLKKYRIDWPRCAVRGCGKLADLSLDREPYDPYVCREHVPLGEFARHVFNGEKGDWLADVTPFPMPMHYWLMNNPQARPFRPGDWHTEVADLLVALNVTVEEEKKQQKAKRGKKTMATMGAPRGHRPKTLAKIYKAIKLREQGLTYPEIAPKAGYRSEASCYITVRRFMLEHGRSMDELSIYRDS